MIVAHSEVLAETLVNDQIQSWYNLKFSRNNGTILMCSNIFDGVTDFDASGFIKKQ